MKELRPTHKSYPKNLLGLREPPERLYISGSILARDRKAIAIVGSRNMTAYGRETAYKFSFYLAKQGGVTIVSGLARGVDTVAHKAALDAGGRTIAVLGHGLARVYPPENKALATRIVKSGALVTEYEQGVSPFGKNFLARNRIISGLSRAVLVVEGAKRSGTLSIAGWAAEQGREVFAIPGRVDSPLSFLPNYLIENGAQIASTPQALLDSIL